MINYVGKVIRIIDKYTIIIDAGSRSLSVGQTVQVYETGEPIKDLDGNVLDKYYHIKDELEVIQVEETYSICRKNKIIKKTSENVFTLSPLLQHEYTERVSLSVDEKEIDPLKTFDSKIHLGDSVKLA